MPKKRPERAPKNHREFVTRFPGVADAWESMGAAARDAGPLDERTCRLVKLGIAIGAQHVGAVHAAVRRARGAGVPDEEIEQTVALAASTIGGPHAAAAWSWVDEALRG
jgi:alkylhydroperoxidase/carboxymuconolactone decarboxylase family protein YurZ